MVVQLVVVAVVGQWSGEGAVVGEGRVVRAGASTRSSPGSDSGVYFAATL